MTDAARAAMAAAGISGGLSSSARRIAWTCLDPDHLLRVNAAD